jgi:copper oxidase (laccase) domain-containing protein
VGPEFVARFRADDPGNRCYFSPAEQPGHAMFDLPGYIARKLLMARVGMIQDLGLDTYRDETHFYSYRRSVHRKEADYGRLVAAIALAS